MPVQVMFALMGKASNEPIATCYTVYAKRHQANEGLEIVNRAHPDAPFHLQDVLVIWGDAVDPEMWMGRDVISAEPTLSGGSADLRPQRSKK